LLFLSASISLVAMIGAFSLGFFTAIPSLRTGMVLGSVALFAIPCTLFGIVVPASIRLRMQTVADSGANVGSLSAISMMGNIVGTFATGFWLVALVGSRSLLAWLALLILLLAAIMGISIRPQRAAAWWAGEHRGSSTPKKLVALAVGAVLIVGAFIWHPQSPNLTGFRLFDTQYGLYSVGESQMTSRTTLGHDGQPVQELVRFLSNSPRAMESAVYADSLQPFFFEYYNFYDIAARLAADQVGEEGQLDALMIGGGAFVYPRFFFQHYPHAHMDVVEIDGALVTEAEASFGFVQPDNMNIYLEDGRMFLNRAAGQGLAGSYDVLILDAFNSANNVPFQLTTLESMQHAAQLLTDDGILVMNMIVSVGGEGSQFLASQYMTLRSVFPQVETYVVRAGDVEPGTPRNVSIIAKKSNAIDLRRSIEALQPELASQRIEPTSIVDVPGAMVLTDDFAPVDQMLLAVNR
ncbi:MAG: fused MFS/spermidine synthase, partial [Coriobacteriia bacterium]|nr:fused MFS/spermidine synthase [Coriobacteriia bacterium]